MGVYFSDPTPRRGPAAGKHGVVAKVKCRSLIPTAPLSSTFRPAALSKLNYLRKFHMAMAEMKARNKIPLPLRSSEIYDEHATTPLEYPAYLVGTLFAKLARQTMKHQPTQHDAELRVGKRKCFNNIIFKCDIEPRFSRLLADPRSQPPKHEPQTYSTTVRMSAIAIPDVLGRFIVTTLTFEELASINGEELGAANSPYAVIGLTISNAVVQADANVNSTSRGVALKSTRFPPETGPN